MEEASETSFTNVCRVCLTEEGEFQSVFVADESSGVTIHLAEMIMAYASVQITLGDGLPEQICVDCAEKAVNMYLFKQRCEESDAALRNQLGKSPLNKMYSIAEEQRLAVEALNGIDPYSLNIVIKPEAEENKLDQNSLAERIELVNENDLNDMFEQVDDDEVELSDAKVKIELYACDVCKKIFSRLNQLNRHKKIHEGPKQFPCGTCNKSYTRSDLLLRHLSRVHNNVKPEDQQIVPFEGILSEEIFVDGLIEVKSEEVVKEEYNSHMMGHMKKPKSSSGAYVGLKCIECNKKFTKYSHLRRHMKIHAAIKPHVCQLCNKGFARAEQLVNHMNAHSGIKPHVCDICQKGFNQVSNLKDHMRTHNGEKPFLCSMCGKGFNQLGNLRQHTIRHSGIKAHLCSTCGNGFASKGELCAHLRKHTGARPFVCSICNHGFTTSSSLTKHKRIHSGEKPYECDVCKMKFSRSGILARHKRTHTGEKPYICRFCTKAFSQSNDLSSHLRIHTGEKPYICDSCGQAFRQSSALKTHKKTHIDRSSLLEVDHARNLVPMIHTTFLNATTLP